MPPKTWIAHSGKLLLIAAAVGFAGWMAGHALAALAVTAIGYGGWHLVNLWRLHSWLQEPDQAAPKSLALWADVFENVEYLKKSGQSRIAGYRVKAENLRELTDAFPDALLVINQEGIIKWCNASAEKLVGIRNPEDVGKSVFSLLRDPDFVEWMALQSRVSSPLDIPSPGGDGRWLTVSSFPLQDHQRLIIFRNITLIHNLEQIRQDFVANISHELRTPLTVLRGYLELLGDHPSAEINDAIGRMLVQALQMQTLLDDLLELSRLQTADLREEDELVDVPGLLAKLSEQAKELSRGHQIVFEADPRLFLMGLAADLESAFTNLITNAIKYTPDDGRITVVWEQGNRGPQLHVRDTGIGIPSREIPRITERFYRVGADRARETGGTGLGLAIVKHVLNEHQAQLTITSEPGAGSQFTCSFPQDRARLQDIPAAAPGSPSN